MKNWKQTACCRDHCDNYGVAIGVLPTYTPNLCLEEENDGEEDEEHEEVYAEDYDDTDHCTQRKQASLPHMHSYPTQ
jgi:hypothetical protein